EHGQLLQDMGIENGIGSRSACGHVSAFLVRPAQSAIWMFVFSMTRLLTVSCSSTNLSSSAGVEPTAFTTSSSYRFFVAGSFIAVAMASDILLTIGLGVLAGAKIATH